MLRFSLMCATVAALTFATPAHAGYWDDFVAWWYANHDAPPEGAPAGFPANPRSAPEPTTLLGLGVGAGAIGLARWRAGRRKAK
jgi:hypothetical protein